ncbi:MAG: dihydropteroate synthase [Leptospiraceae bacterium]|nr:dihydropteroate synthase [Leptospiraceae bacterium]MCP5501200.1 dihydropteroate synthase [Leptospiraceae bacterium]
MDIFGIVNITDDSFSDGGKYLQIEEAQKKALELYNEGADVIDLGAQSSNVDANWIEPEIEWKRLRPMITFLQEKSIRVSVDTFKPAVIRSSIEAGVSFINNINAFQDEESLAILQEYKNQLPELILMYSHSNLFKARKKSYLSPETIMDTILSFFEKRFETLLRANIPLRKCIIDPGMGFFLGEDPELSFTVLRNIHRFKEAFGRVMVSVSRKSFLGTILGGLAPLERKNASLATELYLYEKKVDYIRTHEVKPLWEGMKVLQYIRGKSNG